MQCQGVKMQDSSRPRPIPKQLQRPYTQPPVQPRTQAQRWCGAMQDKAEGAAQEGGGQAPPSLPTHARQVSEGGGPRRGAAALLQGRGEGELPGWTAARPRDAHSDVEAVSAEHERGLPGSDGAWPQGQEGQGDGGEVGKRVTQEAAGMLQKRLGVVGLG